MTIKNKLYLPQINSKFILFIGGLLLIIYSIINIRISPSPKGNNIRQQVLQEIGKTFCVPNDLGTKNIDEAKLKSTMDNAFILMILSLTVGLYIVTFILVELYKNRKQT